MTHKRRIVVTGAAGFVGSSLTARLKEIDNYEIVAIDHKKINDDKIISFVGNYGDVDFLSEIIMKDDIVFHLGCSSIPAVSESDIRKDLNENIIETVSLLKVCQEKQIGLFVFASSGGTVYGNNKNIPIKEEDEASPINFYGVMKLMIEQYINLFNFRHQMNYVIMRPANLFGRLMDFHRPHGAVDVFIQKAINNEPIEIWGDGEVIRDFIYIDDMIDLMLKIIDKEIKDVVINVGSGTGYSLNEVIEAIEMKMEKKLDVRYLPKRGFDVACNVLDISKARSLYDWQPIHDLHEGIDKILKKLEK